MTNQAILIVDDNEDSLDLMRETLEPEGYEVHVARSGPDAMSLLMSQPVDLVLLDVMMPEMNGFAVLEMIRFIPRLMDTAVIIHTAHGDGWNTERAEGLGAKTVLSKPISRSELIDAVREYVVPCV